jgi:HK97 family phage major capsid protein/HK97 family phage prohead protease
MKQPPKDDLFRASLPGLEVRASEDGEPPTLHGHFAVFDQWTEIHSAWEGDFIERIAPGAFNRTFKNNREKMRVLFQHGRDPQIGDKPLGPITDIREDSEGAYYEVPMLDTAYNRELIPGLEAGLYGASFRFHVTREDFDQQPGRSEHNPDGLPERTIREAAVSEFGPVTFPAYEGASAGLRSVSDMFRDPPTTTPNRGDYLVTATGTSTTTNSSAGALSPVRPGPEEGHSDTEPRAEDTAPADTDTEPVEEARGSTEDTPEHTTRRPTMGMNEHGAVARQEEIKSRQAEIFNEYGEDILPPDIRTEWDTLEDEYEKCEALIRQIKEMRRSLETKVRDGHGSVEKVGGPAAPGVSRDQRLPRDIYAVAEYRNFGQTADEISDRYREGAKLAIDTATFPHDRANREETQEHIMRLLDRDQTGDLARHILACGGPTYRRAFAKHVAGVALTAEEQRTLSLTTTAGGFAVPFQLDPTVIPTSNGQVNPLRAISRVETITTNEWRGVSSAGITAAYAAEATETTDNAPVLAQPVCFPERAQAFVPFSIEIGGDWGGLETEMSIMLQDSKDALEASKFLTGLGHASTQPQGLLVGGTAIVTSAGTAALAVADLYSLEEALGPRWRPRARFVGNKFVFNKVRQLDTNGGANLWVRLDAASPPELIGYPAHELSTMVAALASAGSILTFGDFNNFLIVDRVGMTIEVIPHLFGTARNYPTGQRGIFAYWRNSSQVLAQEAFKTLKTL